MVLSRVLFSMKGLSYTHLSTKCLRIFQWGVTACPIALTSFMKSNRFLNKRQRPKGPVMRGEFREMRRLSWYSEF